MFDILFEFFTTVRRGKNVLNIYARILCLFVAQLHAAYIKLKSCLEVHEEQFRHLSDHLSTVGHSNIINVQLCFHTYNSKSARYIYIYYVHATFARLTIFPPSRLINFILWHCVHDIKIYLLNNASWNRLDDDNNNNNCNNCTINDNGTRVIFSIRR